MISLKKLVVFYSFEGNTKFLAKTIAKEINADILELKPKKEIKTKGFFKYPIGGAQVVFGIKPKLQPIEINPDDYDIIFLGTPTWSLSYTPTMRSFLSKYKLKNKKIGLFCSRMSRKGRTFKAMKGKLAGNEILGEIDFSQPLIKGKEKDQEKIKKWAKEIINR